MTSFAKNVSPAPLSADTPRPGFEAASRSAALTTQPRASSMVRGEQPKPSLKPSAALAYGPDGTAFHAAWEDEAKAARRESFKAKRRSQQQHTRNRDIARSAH